MKNLKIGQRVLLRATEWNDAQQAEVIGIDQEVVMYRIEPAYREAFDRDGLVEGSRDEILRLLDD